MRTKCKALAELEWFERFVFLLIVINTACLSLTRYDQPVSEVYAMNIANLVFTVLFTLEAGIKIMGLGGAYFDESWNCFDFAVVVVGWTEVVVVVILPAESVFLNGVRALRILRIVRMFKTWQTMQKYLVQLYHCVQSAGPPFLLLAVVMFAFSLCGLQFFGGLLHYDKAQVLAGELERECPREKLFYYPYCPKRENFDSFGSAWVACFQVITSEITVVFSSIQAISYFTLIFYLALIVVGVFLLINVFLVVLMQAFSSSIDEKPNKCLSFPAAAKLLHVLLGMKRRAQQRLGQAENGLSYRKCSGGSKPIQVQRIRHPSAPYKALKILKWSHPLRALCAKVALSKAFDRMVLLLIIASCVVLTIDSGATCKHAPAYAETSPILSPETCHALATVDLCFNIIFLLEALVKIIAFGFAGHPGAYDKPAGSITIYPVTPSCHFLTKVYNTCRRLHPQQLEQVRPVCCGDKSGRHNHGHIHGLLSVDCIQGLASAARVACVKSYPSLRRPPRGLRCLHQSRPQAAPPLRLRAPRLLDFRAHRQRSFPRRPSKLH